MLSSAANESIRLHHKYSPTRPLIHYLKLTIQFVWQTKNRFVFAFDICMHKNLRKNPFFSNFVIQIFIFELGIHKATVKISNNEFNEIFITCHKNYQNETGYMSKIAIQIGSCK